MGAVFSLIFFKQQQQQQPGQVAETEQRCNKFEPETEPEPEPEPYKKRGGGGGRSEWEHLPDEILVNIFHRLDGNEFKSVVPQVCPSWRSALQWEFNERIISLSNGFGRLSECINSIDNNLLKEYREDVARDLASILHRYN